MSIPALTTLAEAEAALAADFKAGTIDEVELAEGLSAAYQAAFGGASTPLEAAVLAQQAISRLTAFVDEFLGNVGLKPGVLDDEDDLPTTGNAVGDSYVIDSNLWVWAGSTDGWQNAGPIVGPAGKNVELRKSSTHVQWRLVGAADWIDLIALADLKGTDGQEVELRANSTHIQCRLGDGEWSNLIALSVLKGADGREVEFNVGETHLQWRYVGSTDWANLFSWASVTPEAIPGPAAWTAVIAKVADGERRVEQIVDWIGGGGTKPDTGMFIGPEGWVETAAEATDVRGAGGSGSGDMIAANNLSDLTDKPAARTTLQVYSKTETDAALATKADLVGGKVSISQLPALAITDVFEVANQAAMLALTAERGDVAIRTDENKSYVLAAEPATTLANWKLLRTPTDVVLSVAGLTGAITKEDLVAALEITAGGDASVIGDIKLSAANPGSKWRACNGATYLRSSYPDVGSILPNLTAPLASWTAKTKPAVSGIGAYGAGLYVLIPGSGTTYYTSPDGETWTTRTLPVNLSWPGFIFAGGQFVLMSGTRNVLTSSDGINWTNQTTALPSGGIGGQVAYNGELYMSLDGGSAEVVYTSPDGVNWTSRARPGGGISGARIAGGNGRFVITRVSSAEVYSSGDGGVTWTTGAMPSSTSWQGIAYGKGLFVAIANGGTVAAWSADGITWTSATMPASSNWWHIAFVGQNFVALTFATGTVAAVSADGKTWTATTLSASASYNALIAGPRALALGGSSTTAAQSNLLSDASQFMTPVIQMPEPVVAYVKVLV